MHIERHVFGSISGYGTLARSPGLTAHECRQLESVAFGTPYEPSYQTSLSRKVACWSRPLGPGKRAISRVLQGQPDDAGRPTLLFVTAVVSADDWNFTVQGDVRPLLRQAELWKWDGSPNLAALEIDGIDPGPLRLGRDSAHRVMGLISLVELSWTARQSVVVREEDYSLDEVAAVERLLPTAVRRNYSAVYRSLNPEMSASLNCLTSGIPADTSNPIRHLDLPKSPYALLLAQQGLADGRVPDVLLVGYDNFGQPRVDAGDSLTEDLTVDIYTRPSEVDTSRPGAAPIHPLLLAASLLLVLIVGGTVGWLTHSAIQPATTVSAAASSLPWEKLLCEAVDLPTQPRDRQLETIDDLQTELRKPGFADSSQTAELTKSLSDLRRTVQLARDVEKYIAKVTPDDSSSIKAANKKLDTLAARNPRMADTLRDRLDARRRPAEDTLAIVSDRLRNKVAPRLEAMESQSDLIDVRALERARELRGSLNLFESATTDRQLPWVADHLSRLDTLIRGWDRKLASLDRQQQQQQQRQTTREQENREQLSRRLQDLSDALQQTNGSASVRNAIGQALRQVAREGQAGMGNVFSRPMSQLAEWLLALRDVAPPKEIDAIQNALKECQTSTHTLTTGAERLSVENTKEESDKIAGELRKDARTLADQLSELTKLIEQLEKEAQPQGDRSP